MNENGDAVEQESDQDQDDVRKLQTAEDFAESLKARTSAGDAKYKPINLAMKESYTSIAAADYQGLRGIGGFSF